MTTSPSERAGISRVAARVVEYFTLREAKRASLALSGTEGEALTGALARARELRDAAETLWPRGRRAVALALLRQSIDVTADALLHYERAASGAPSAWLAQAQAAVAVASGMSVEIGVPAREEDVMPAHASAFPALVDRMLTVDRELLFPHASRLRDLSRARRVRLTWLGVVLAAAVVVACSVMRRPAVVARSDAHVTNHEAMLAIDHDTRTSWATPDGQPAALDLAFRSARPVDALHLLPSDPPSNGYAIERARVEAFLEGRRVAEVDATFPKPRLGVVEWADVAVGASACDRVRVEVTSFYGKAGAISEVEVSP